MMRVLVRERCLTSVSACVTFHVLGRGCRLLGLSPGRGIRHRGRTRWWALCLGVGSLWDCARGWKTARALYPVALSPVTTRNVQVPLDPESGPPLVILDEGTLSVLTTEKRRGLAHPGDRGVGSGHPAAWRQAGVPAHLARPAPHLSGAGSSHPLPARAVVRHRSWKLLHVTSGSGWAYFTCLLFGHYEESC